MPENCLSGGIDFSNKLIIKARLGSDVRKVLVNSEDMTIDDLVLMLQRVFKGLITPQDEIVLKYKDEDGDLITLCDTQDLNVALHWSRSLKLTIFVSNRPISSIEQSDEIYQELKEIREMTDKLMSALKPKEPGFVIGSAKQPHTCSNDVSKKKGIEGAPSETTRDSVASATHIPPPAAPIPFDQGRIFDPYASEHHDVVVNQNIVKQNAEEHGALVNGSSTPVNEITKVEGVAEPNASLMESYQSNVHVKESTPTPVEPPAATIHPSVQQEVHPPHQHAPQSMQQNVPPPSAANFFGSQQQQAPMPLVSAYSHPQPPQPHMQQQPPVQNIAAVPSSGIGMPVFQQTSMPSAVPTGPFAYQPQQQFQQQQQQQWPSDVARNVPQSTAFSGAVPQQQLPPSAVTAISGGVASNGVYVQQAGIMPPPPMSSGAAGPGMASVAPQPAMSAGPPPMPTGIPLHGGVNPFARGSGGPTVGSQYRPPFASRQY